MYIAKHTIEKANILQLDDVVWELVIKRVPSEVRYDFAAFDSRGRSIGQRQSHMKHVLDLRSVRVKQ